MSRDITLNLLLSINFKVSVIVCLYEIGTICETTESTPVINANGAKCVFPFEYSGQKYYSCITVNTNIPWCAVTDNYDRNQQWGYCQGMYPNIEFQCMLENKIMCLSYSIREHLPPLCI